MNYTSLNYTSLVAKIESHLPDGVTLTPEARQLMERTLGAIVDSGAIKASRFWSGSEPVTQENLIKRAISNLSNVVHHPGYRIGLINFTPENLAWQQEMLSFQVKELLPHELPDKTKEHTAAIIAEVILVTWALSSKK